MYWPIGSPNVYALSKNAPALRLSDDGIRTDGGKATGAEGEGPGRDVTLGGQAASDSAPTTNGIDEEQASSTQQSGTSKGDGNEVLGAKMSRGGGLFATITRSTLTVWQAKPSVALAAIERSAQSMQAYGPNVNLLLRPDAFIIVVQTLYGYLITYTLAIEPRANVYELQLPDTGRHLRNGSTDGYSSYRRGKASNATPIGGHGAISEVNLRFRMVIRIDAGISSALALDDELVIGTTKPAAIQCIRWASENGAPQTSTDLISRLGWVQTDAPIIEMVHDRAMNISCWITGDGYAYAVQRRKDDSAGNERSRSMFQGYCFRECTEGGAVPVKVAINARFSLIALGYSDGRIEVYAVKDYTGNIPLSHTLSLPGSSGSLGALTVLSYSPDGYCLYAGYEKGWSFWSVYGKAGATSAATNTSCPEANDEHWLRGVRDAFWIGGGCELAMVGYQSDCLWILPVARNAAACCLSQANISRGLLHSPTAVMIYEGHDVPDLTSLPSDMALWRIVEIPRSYLADQWPIKAATTSADGKYVAVAGRRGLAHYSKSSGRWKTFDDIELENDFAVRGGMCWHQHFLITAVESGTRPQMRVYSREKALERPLHVEELTAPAVLTTLTGTDSLLVYTYDNILLHYIIVPNGSSVKLVQVGQIGFHGIIRAPPRVRAISWILPDDQLEHGDPSQDVATASVVFLVDGKLVLLQPSTNEQGELKYDMRVIAQNVEYYILQRDQPPLQSTKEALEVTNGGPDSLSVTTSHLGHSLRDSLWYFEGNAYHVWSDVNDVLACAPSELGRDLPPTVRIFVDFYPVSAMVAKGVVHGLDPDLVQRRDVNFSFFRQATRTQLFLPQLLRYHLTEYNAPAALHLARSYQHLHYFAHALEILLHDVLDSEVDNPPSPPETAVLPSVVSFLSSYPSYLDVIVNCTRKTELRSWRTLFSCLPPVKQLFEQSLVEGKLQTAAGYLLVLHSLEEGAFQAHEFARLMWHASVEQDWELCKELSRFLVGIDDTGQILCTVLEEAGLRSATNGSPDSSVLLRHGGSRRPTIDATIHDAMQTARPNGVAGHSSQPNGFHGENGDEDYFSIHR